MSDNNQTTVASRAIEREFNNIKVGFKNAAEKFGIYEKSRSFDSTHSVKSDNSPRKLSLDSQIKNGVNSSHLKWFKNKELKWEPKITTHKEDVQIFNNNIRRISLQPKPDQISNRFLSRKLSNESYFGPIPTKKSSITLTIFKNEHSFKKTSSDLEICASREQLNLPNQIGDINLDDTSTITSGSSTSVNYTDITIRKESELESETPLKEEKNDKPNQI
jgi:hypothetical protein